METWEGLSPAEWQRRWRIPRLLVHATTGSTNDDARSLALEGSPAGTVVLGDHQSAGRGREGRAWEADPGCSLLVSIILRPDGHGAEEIAPATPIRVGLAVAAAIDRCSGLATRLKWPNDVLSDDGRKLAGILCEAALGTDGAFVVAGIGVNVLQRRWPAHLAGLATSVLTAAGRAPARPELAAALIDALRPFRLAGPRLDESELRAYSLRDALRGRAISVDGVPAGVADGIDPDGALRIATAGGHRAVRAGTVRLLGNFRQESPHAVRDGAPQRPSTR